MDNWEIFLIELMETWNEVLHIKLGILLLCGSYIEFEGHF